MSSFASRERNSRSSSQNKNPAPKMSKKKELRADFLLNFQRPPSNQRPQQYAPPRRSRAPRARAPASFAKGRFVQSSFRLFVEDEAAPDVVEAAFDADAMLDWNSVRRVDLICEQQPKCPICLELELVVPKITRCGHLFCFPCVMRYFLTMKGYNGKVYQRCPVCNEQVSPDGLISARLEMAVPLRDGSACSFVLAHKNIGSTLVRLTSESSAQGDLEGSHETSPDEAGPLIRLPHEGEAGWKLSRVILLRPEEAWNIIEQELEDLSRFRTAAIAEGDTELVPGASAAAQLLERQRRSPAEGFGSGTPGGGPRPRELRTPGRGRLSSAGSDSLPEQAEPYEMLPPPAELAEEEEEDWEAQGSQEQLGQDFGEAQSDGGPAGGASSSCTPQLGPLDSEVSSPSLSAQVFSPGFGPACSSLDSPSGPKPFGRPVVSPSPGLGASEPRNGGMSFYQAADGRPVFLQPFFTKLLAHEYGGRWDQFPRELPELRIDRMQESTITEETRRRHKFLSHLPLGSSISFAEVDLRNYLSRGTKEHFAEDFAKRRQQRKKDQNQSRKEERFAKVRAAEDEERFYSSLSLYPSMVQALPTKDDFAVPLPGRNESEEPGEPQEGEAAEGAEDAQEAPTLADKIKEKLAGKKAQVQRQRDMLAGAKEYFPELGSGGGPTPSAVPTWGPSSQSSKGPAWGRKDAAAAGAKAAGEAAKPGPVTPMEDSWDTRIEEQPTFGDALEAALRRGSSAAVEAPDADGEAAGAAGKKKKGRAKATTIRLFG
ncbi:unnamed protein product [Polarella glacialis]|uniref:RING-type domain-containing protein n=1 Tax=Polarella glacialis TaxID=89957 RepID=A0A813GMI0_POLGL|nr:unnamed protein product [Polarella glacialis]CAE8661450.1 unnamed protein product [Polarella glacialis]